MFRKLSAVVATALLLAAVPSEAQWARGIEGQRKADLGNGFYRNPILAGDYPDPTIIREGADYYLTHSSFDAVPGLVIWHSQDLVSWQPLGPALTTAVDSVWAPDLVKHGGRYFIYFVSIVTNPVTGAKGRKLYVVTAENIRGPWAAPREIVVRNAKGGQGATIDPGHAVGEDGKRYLFMAGGVRVQLRDDGLAVADGEAGVARVVYEGWKYPEDWDVESFSMEGPKIARHGGYFYMVLAEGGTAGPPTGHMVVVARSRSIHGPWENAPNNPVVRTRDAKEAWWSRGHATLIEGPDGKWYSVHHGYENGFMTLGRQMLLEPIEWTADGWFRALGGDLGQPLAMPSGGKAVPHGMALSDSFTPERFDLVWRFFQPGPNEKDRVKLKDGVLTLAAKGTSPKDSVPLILTAGDRSYEIEVVMEFDEGAQAGILLFYSKALYVGLGFSANGHVMHRYGQERVGGKLPNLTGNRVHVRLRNQNNIVTFWTSPDGKAWTKYPVQMEVSGYHQNTGGDFQALRPGIYAAGEGKARIVRFQYRNAIN
ncbi:xylan 1,4-beta-xylosidase [Betaproteobacteria bacterium GR16-43]|nr:xylan 1,4-beta-xylosidase [Betaproteobacteria bacterium GR16-43]